MRRFGLPLAMAALLALGGLVLVEALRPAAPPTSAQQAAQLAAELRCPDCQALSVAESNTAAAAAFRSQIADLLATGHTPEQVRRHFVDRYGSWILLTPATPLVWLIPAAAILGGTLLFALWLRRGRGQAGRLSDASRPSDAARRRISDEIEELDA